MAYVYRRPGGRSEIREAHTTPRGPRSRTLVSFTGALSDSHLERAAAVARGSFDRDAILERAAQLGIPCVRERADAAARELVARLRSGCALDPRLATVLHDQLSRVASQPLADSLEDVVDWIGSSDAQRGRALRDVLRLYGIIAQSREPVRERPLERFPRFTSQPVEAVS